MSKKYIYFFGGGKTEGSSSMKKLLGGKGANLAEMANVGAPVPPGFTITTEACAEFQEKGKDKFFSEINDEVQEQLRALEEATGKTFGGGENPLLVSVRSGAAVSMPGMMDTVLNLGLNDETIDSMIKKTGNKRFVMDAYRRFIQMFGDVVQGIEGSDFEKELQAVKDSKGANLDTDLTAEDLEEVIEKFKKVVKEHTGEEFPQDPQEQLWQGIDAVFGSWSNPRAIKYRELNDIRGLLGTAVNVQTMVFGNAGNDCATGVAFTRDPSTGDNKYFYGEFLVNAQGEDVVAGTRTPQQITIQGSREWAESNNISEEERASKYPSLEEVMPECFKQLDDIRVKLENHYRDMQDLEFTIENGNLYMLQTRNGKRTAKAAVRIATDLVKEDVINEKEAVTRVDPNQLDQLLHPVFVKSSEEKAETIVKGLPASPGAATGQIVFNADDAEEWANAGHTVILARLETSPEDITGMHVAEGVLTVKGGMTSHAAVVARGMGRCCIAGCGDLAIDYEKKQASVGDMVLKEGDWISLNGTSGQVYKGKIDTVEPSLTGPFGEIMELADKYRKLNVRTNSDTPQDTDVAVKFGAEGIGLTRTEHMFFEGDRIISVRRLILAAEEVKTIKQDHEVDSVFDLDEDNCCIKDSPEKKSSVKQYKRAIKELLPLQRGDFEGIFKSLQGRPATIRFLDPPLHEFLPNDEEGQKEMAQQMEVSFEAVRDLVDNLHEVNPMLGHRGCRLGITYPEVTEMQARAILEAATNVPGSKAEIMIPLVGNVKELSMQKAVVNKVKEQVEKETNVSIDVKIGTMIEVPRAAMTADEVAKEAEFFSFGTNDLTQMSCGFSRDDAGRFLKEYVANGIYEYDPFQVLDQDGVGRFVDTAVKLGRQTRPDIKLGICGEHGGDPSSVEFCHRVGLNYVSCSPFRVPIARLAAAQAAIRETNG